MPFDMDESKDEREDGPNEHNRGAALGPILGTLVLDALNKWASSLEGSANPICQGCVRTSVTSFIVADLIKRKRARGTPENAIKFEIEMMLELALDYSAPKS